MLVGLVATLLAIYGVAAVLLLRELFVTFFARPAYVLTPLNWYEMEEDEETLLTAPPTTCESYV